jgi:hypothetical protein
MLEATGIMTPEKLIITACSEGQVRDGAVVLSLETGKRTEIEVTFSENYEGPLEITAMTEVV